MPTGWRMLQHSVDHAGPWCFLDRCEPPGIYAVAGVGGRQEGLAWLARTSCPVAGPACPSRPPRVRQPPTDWQRTVARHRHLRTSTSACVRVRAPGVSIAGSAVSSYPAICRLAVDARQHPPPARCATPQFSRVVQRAPVHRGRRPGRLGCGGICLPAGICAAGVDASIEPAAPLRVTEYTTPYPRQRWAAPRRCRPPSSRTTRTG